tara:strand:- start:29 stop:1276 length:1248 start_codon:yes stop_codon:yes gene_type:complete
MYLFFIYYFLSPFFFVVLKIISIFSTKIKVLQSDQKKSLLSLKSKLNTNKKKIIIHAASAGEYEQVKPLIKKIDKNIYFIIVTCMSPTIYNLIKQDNLGNVCCYHPFDFPWAAKTFYKIIDPDIYLTTRHDVWPIHLNLANKFKIKTIIINANLYENSSRLKWYSISFTRYIFNLFDAIIVPTKRIKKVFENHLKINSLNVISDTRFDQILYRKKHFKEIFELNNLSNDNIIFGSISSKDLTLIASFIQNLDLKKITQNLIIVPHEIDLQLINDIEKVFLQTKHFKQVKRFTFLDKNSLPKVIIIDKVGILPELYKYSKFAYIGGGFGAGVHSTIEPLVYNNIVCYGPNIDLLDEAKEMNEIDCGFIVNNGKEFYEKYLEYLNISKFQEIKIKINEYLNAKKASSNEIIKVINDI